MCYFAFCVAFLPLLSLIVVTVSEPYNAFGSAFHNREILFLPLEERLKKWFTEVSEVNHFDALKHLAPTISEEETLKVLPDYAYLVRGLWVCKSSLLFDDGYASKRQNSS